MSVLAHDTTAALAALRAALAAPSTGSATTAGDPAGRWRWTVRQRLAALREVLTAPADAVGDDWLTARHSGLVRERTLLLQRLGALNPRVLEHPDLAAVRDEAGRLLVDVEHHLQRRRDLAWDEVELDLGGSE
jgi:hypothetical protein